MFANSRYTADDVERTLGFARERIVVAHPGIHERFRAEGPKTELGSPYLFTAASFEPRKNLRTLLEAFAQVRARRPELELVIAGAQGDTGTEGARTLGYVPDDELPALYRGAEAFVFPSLFEGFGIPVAEWLKTDLREPVLDELSPDRLRRQGLFAPDEVGRLLAEHLAGPPEGA